MSQALYDDLITLRNEIQNLKLEKFKHRSYHIDDLATSLSKAQAEMHVAGLNKKNPFFKSSYADFKEIVEASREALSKNMLSVVQAIIDEQDECRYLYTTLLHGSGQFIESKIKIVAPKADVQSLAGTVTYLKRMAYSALIGVVTGDEDDDGETATMPYRQSGLNQPKEYAREELVITPEQLGQLTEVLGDDIDMAQQIMDGFKIKRLSDIPRNKFNQSVERVRVLKGLKAEARSK